MSNEMNETDINSAILSIAIQKRIEAQQRALYPTAEDIVNELNNQGTFKSTPFSSLIHNKGG